MNRSDDSLRVNNSIHFAFEQSGIKNGAQSIVRKDTYDDLQYSIDSMSSSVMTRDLNQFQEKKMMSNIPTTTIVMPMVVMEQQVKRERKGIFDKNTPRNMGVANNGTGQIEREVGNVPREIEIVASKRNQIFSNTKAPVKQPPVEHIPPRMAPPPLLPRTVPQSQHQPQLLPKQPSNLLPNNRTSINSLNSVVINDHNSLIINDLHNPYHQSRESRDVSDSLGDKYGYGSFQAGDISLIQQNSELDVSQSSVRSVVRSTLLEEMRLSEKGQGGMISGVGVVESQQGGGSGVKGRVSAPPVLAPNQTIEQTYIQNLSNLSANQQPQTQTNFIEQLNQSPSQIFPSPPPHPTQPFFLKPTSLLSNLAQNNPSPQPLPPASFIEDINHPSNISIHSIHSDLDFKSSIDSNLISSDSLNRALGALSPYTFLQPTVQSRVPQLLQECWRLNSVSINLRSPNLALDSIRHKEVIRNQIFEALIATQTLQKIRDELENRETKQKKIVKAFSTSAFLQGEWYEVNRVRNTQLIKPKEAHSKRPVDYERIKEILRNSFDVLKYYQGFIEYFRIQPSQQFKQKYIQLRNSLFQIYNNLNKICEDLYMKSIHNYLPDVYFKVFEYLKKDSRVKGNGSVMEVNERIEDRKKILQEMERLKKEKDPLIMSEIGKDVETKIREQIQSLRLAAKK